MEHFLQSEPWARLQESLGKTVHRETGPGFSYLAIEEKNPAGRFLYVPYGPVAKDPAALDAALASLTALARERKASFVRVEPVDAGISAEEADAVLGARGLVRAPRNQQPELTWVIDLDREVKEILAGMKPTNRNLYRNIHKKGVTFRVSQDPEEIGVLLEFLHQTAARSGFKPQSDDYLAKVARSLMPAGAASLFIAELEGTPIAAALAYDSADTRTYAHAAIDDAHRKLSAGIPLLVTLIVDAKEKGLAAVDLWGIAPEGQPGHKWAGFTAFKKSFGGREVAYPGTWDLPVNRAVYGAYQLARHGAQTARKALAAGRKALGALRKLRARAR